MVFLIIFLIIYAVVTGMMYNNCRKKNKESLLEIEILRKERGKLSNSVRKKGIEADNLRIKIKRLKASLDK